MVQFVGLIFSVSPLFLEIFLPMPSVIGVILFLFLKVAKSDQKLLFWQY